MVEQRLKILIVDDEYRIGMLIKKITHWEELNLLCIGVVDNGEKAYEVIIEQAPDVVITDIRMPKINGLDLIKMTKERKKKEVAFIVISGYKEFEYAHQALQYGVNDYLLKPVNEEELNQVLQKLRNKIIKKSLEQKEEEEMKQEVMVSKQIIKSKLLNTIIEESDPPSEDRLFREYHLLLKPGIYRGLDIKLDYCDFNSVNIKQDKLMVEKIHEIVEQHFKGKVNEQLLCSKQNLHIYCLLNYDESFSKEIKNTISNILIEIQEQLSGFDKYEVTIGVGKEKMQFGEIRFSIQEAYRAIQNRIKVGTGRLIYEESMEHWKKVHVLKYIEKYKDAYLTSIESYSRQSLNECINEIYGGLQLQAELDSSWCYDITYELIVLFFQNIEIEDSEGEKKKQFLLENYLMCSSIIKLKNLMKGIMGEYLESSLKVLQTESAKPIRQAKQYIDKHYSEKIVLEDIAKIVDLNPVYFSVLFKKETGMNFSAYLVHIRMEAAKDMIRTSNETIAAIADKVGYKDARYFSQIFTKSVGIKPVLYRKLHS